jgi:hypothetical protein
MKCRIRQIPLTACLTFRPYLSSHRNRQFLMMVQRFSRNHLHE